MSEGGPSYGPDPVDGTYVGGWNDDATNPSIQYEMLGIARTTEWEEHAWSDTPNPDICAGSANGGSSTIGQVGIAPESGAVGTSNLFRVDFLIEATDPDPTNPLYYAGGAGDARSSIANDIFLTGLDRPDSVQRLVQNGYCPGSAYTFPVISAQVGSTATGSVRLVQCGGNVASEIESVYTVTLEQDTP
jgi:hypothetical protein